MLLTVNIGNTHTVAALCQEGVGWTHWERIPTASYGSPRDFLARLALPQRPEDAIVASVVPEKAPVVTQALASLTGQSPVCILDAADCGLDLSAYDASLLGVDRILCCIGALEKFPAPLAVFDLGTAVSISVIDAHYRFLGGAILPGLRLGLEALSRGASLLPEVSLEAPPPLIGENTAECMRAGAVFGAAGAIDGYARRLRASLGEDLTLVATGGGAKAVLPCCDEAFYEEPALLMEGLLALYPETRHTGCRLASFRL